MLLNEHKIKDFFNKKITIEKIKTLKFIIIDL